jgi:hypothetical protein
VKRSGRDEPVWVETHMCMVTTLGIPLYSYLHLKLANMLCLSYYLLYVFLIISYVFSSTKLEKRAEQVMPGSEGSGEEGERKRGVGGKGVGGRGGPKNVYT